MQRETTMERNINGEKHGAAFFYNFRYKFSYNFERSDRERNGGRPDGLKIIKKLNQKIIRTMQRGVSMERNMAQHFFIIFETNFLIILSPKGDQRTRDSGRFAQNYRKIGLKIIGKWDCEGVASLKIVKKLNQKIIKTDKI